MRDNHELAEAAYAALNAGDQEAFLALIHPEAEFESLIAEAEGQTFRGHEGVREWWTSVVQAFAGMTFEPEEIRFRDDAGLSRIRVRGSVGGVEVPQTMWQAILIREGKTAWWSTYRTEAEATAALESRVAAERQ